jgi:hypothetical protein
MKNEQLADCKTKNVYFTCVDGYVWFCFGQTDDCILAELLTYRDGGYTLGPMVSLPHERFAKVIDRSNDVAVISGEVSVVEPRKRQSTTAKITLAHVENIEKDVENGNGVLIRYRRQTLGVVGVERINGKVFFRVRETSTLIPRIGCTVPKATVDAWEAGAVVTLNVGRKLGEYGLLDDQFVRSTIAWGSIYNVSQSFRESVGQWKGADEPTIIATGRTTISREKLLTHVVELANTLGQEAIAVEIDGVGSLVWADSPEEDWDRTGKIRYTFDPAYFIR